MSISGLRKASFYNPVTGVIVQVNNLAGEGEFRAAQPIETDDRTTGDEMPHAGDESFLELLIYDMSVLPQLEAWQRADVPISCVAAGFQENIQWYERDFIQVEKRVPTGAGRRNRALVRMQRKGGGDHDVHKQVNLLAHLGWQDADTDEVADGYQLAGGAATPDFAANVQTITTAATDDGLQASIVYPIAGVRLRHSFEITQLHTDPVERSLRAVDFSGASLQQDDAPVAGTGRDGVTQKTPSQTYEVVAFPMRQASGTTSDAMAGQFPALRVDGRDDYLTH